MTTPHGGTPDNMADDMAGNAAGVSTGSPASVRGGSRAAGPFGDGTPASPASTPPAAAKPRTDQRKAYLYGIATVAIWSTVATAFKLALRQLDPLQLLLVSTAVSLVVLAGILLVRHGFGGLVRELAGCPGANCCGPDCWGC